MASSLGLVIKNRTYSVFLKINCITFVCNKFFAHFSVRLLVFFFIFLQKLINFLSILFMPHIILFSINFFVIFSLVKFIDFAIVYFIIKRVILLVCNILCIICIICINLNEYIISILYRSILAYNLCQNPKERISWSSNITISVNFFSIF